MKTLAGTIIVLALAGLVPFGLIALARSRPSPLPPVHPIHDMDQQQKFKPQRPNAMFADSRAMRPLLPGAEARQDLLVPNELLNDSVRPRWIDGRAEPLAPGDDAALARLTEGIEPPAGGKTVFATQIPVPVSMDLMRRGQERFNVYCAPCHGAGGYGDGMVARRAGEMQASGADTATGWVTPTSYHSDDLRSRPVGQLYNTVANGIRTMPAYAKQISVLDRWAIVAYVKALQRSQHARSDDVPETEQHNFPK